MELIPLSNVFHQINGQTDNNMLCVCIGCSTYEMKNIYACEMEVKIFFYVWKTVIEDEIIGDSRSYTGLVKNLQLAIWPL